MSRQRESFSSNRLIHEALICCTTQQKMICYMRCVNVFFIDITNIFVNMTDFSCHFNQKDTLHIPNKCLCVILTYYFLLCTSYRFDLAVYGALC